MFNVFNKLVTFERKKMFKNVYENATLSGAVFPRMLKVGEVTEKKVERLRTIFRIGLKTYVAAGWPRCF